MFYFQCFLMFLFGVVVFSNSIVFSQLQKQSQLDQGIAIQRATK